MEDPCLHKACQPKAKVVQRDQLKTRIISAILEGRISSSISDLSLTFIKKKGIHGKDSERSPP